jgi:amino acid transporter
VAKQRQQRMQYRAGTLGAVQQLESRTDEQLLRETRHRVAARAILGARAAERYEAKQARAYFNEALAGAHPQERPALRQMMKASLALAERRPDELKEAVEKLGQEPPSSRQLLLLRVMGLISPPPGSSMLLRVRGFALLLALVIVLVAIGFGLVELVSLPFGGIGATGAVLIGVLVVIAVLGVLTLFGRRRQARATEKRRAEAREAAARQ